MIILFLLSTMVLAYGLRNQAGYLKTPTLVSILYLAWFLPQLSGVSSDATVPSSGYHRLVVMMALSLIAFWLGWYWKSDRVQPAAEVDVTRIIPPALVLTLFSVAINLLLARYRSEWSGGQQWSGPITIVAFFSQIRDVALVLSLLLVLKRPTPLTIVMLAVNLAVTLPIAFTFLRRAEMIGLGAAILCTYWFVQRRTLSMLILVPAAIALGVTVYVIGPLRGMATYMEMTTGTRPSLLDPVLWGSIDLKAAFERTTQTAPDVRNALYVIDHTAQNLSFQFGARTWDGFVKQYIPGQIFGHDFKSSLYLSAGGSIYDEIFIEYNFSYGTGTTSTGFGSAFSDFGFLGVLYFFMIARAMKLLYNRSMVGQFWAQLAYACFLPLVLLSLTHGHEKLFNSVPYLAGVILMLRAASRRRWRLTSSHTIRLDAYGRRTQATSKITSDRRAVQGE